MTPEQRKNVADWVAALRSGRYTQGRRVLTRADGADCCLGVLCKVQRVPTAPEHSSYHGTPYAYDFGDGVVEEAMVPHKWFHEVTGLVIPPPSLSALNDKLRLSFDEIADAIEWRVVPHIDVEYEDPRPTYPRVV